MKFLDFERPIAELEDKVEELRHLSNSGSVNIADEVSRLQGKAKKMLETTTIKSLAEDVEKGLTFLRR